MESTRRSLSCCKHQREDIVEARWMEKASVGRLARPVCNDCSFRWPQYSRARDGIANQALTRHPSPVWFRHREITAGVAKEVTERQDATRWAEYGKEPPYLTSQEPLN
ncbi:hypothetical protein PV326_003662 [Microctonus aethiopoides]|nr:hypothetical protein PV326_003662 [Microctonus aethiopoides]